LPEGLHTAGGASDVYFHKTDGAWKKEMFTPNEALNPASFLGGYKHSAENICYEFGVEGKSALVRLRPQFERLAFGRVEEVSFKDSDGYERHAGLYYQ